MNLFFTQNLISCRVQHGLVQQFTPADCSRRPLAQGTAAEFNCYV